MSPDPELSLQKGAYTTEDLFCGTRFPQRLENCAPGLNVFKTSFHGKDFSNTPWPIVAFIIRNVSFCILNVLVNSFLEYFSLVINTIPRKTM